MTVDYRHVGTLQELESLAMVCTDCRLSETRTSVVFASGSPEADVMVVGEAPGQHEDEQGVPFVGRSGQLLVELFGEVGIKREDMYITNVVKCRPPHNRNPQQDEIDSCKPYLRRQVELVDPRVVVTVGNFSSQLLMPTTLGITRLRGQAYAWWGRHLVPTFHPAAALRGGASVVEAMRADVALARSLLDHKLEADIEDTAAPAATGVEESMDVQLDLFGAAPR